ncbi:D-glycero-alpha-D-manno-heptose-1,7-bisphosphate 7-phosphatase [Lichenifustis flavocetrariae]|uniref:D-glycero-alpha-D-manno-heptose-1,7-bisphosphate 7-phosphatase n=1 Tax=Lichenifustis flavocetrariae TaxID=2949735 RepID=UPI003D0B247C
MLIEDSGYPHRPEDVVLIPEALALVPAANARGVAVGIVTNQSGIGRGLFDWPAFSSVQVLIDKAVQALGGHIDFVLACPYHADAAVLRYRREAHDWRKPAPGMIAASAHELGLDLARSCMVGDRISDMEAAAAAGIPHRLLVGNADRVDQGDVHCTPVPRSGLAAALAQSFSA